MFTHKPVEIAELSTKNINRKRFYVTPEGKLYPLSLLYFKNKR